MHTWSWWRWLWTPVFQGFPFLRGQILGSVSSSECYTACSLSGNTSRDIIATKLHIRSMFARTLAGQKKGKLPTMWPHLGNSFPGQPFIIVCCTMLQLNGCCCSGIKGNAFAARVHPGTPLLCSLGTKNHLLRTILWHKKSLWEGEKDWNTLKTQTHFPSFFSYTFAVWIQGSIPFVAGPQQSTRKTLGCLVNTLQPLGAGWWGPMKVQTRGNWHGTNKKEIYVFTEKCSSMNCK